MTSHARAVWRLHCHLHSGGILGAATCVSLDRASLKQAALRKRSGVGRGRGHVGDTVRVWKWECADEARQWRPWQGLRRGWGANQRSTIAPKLHKRPRRRHAEHVWSVGYKEGWGYIQLAECLDHTCMVLETRIGVCKECFSADSSAKQKHQKKHAAAGYPLYRENTGSAHLPKCF